MDQINITKMTAKSTSEQLSDIWPKLSRNQRRFVVASQEYASKKDAAEAIGIKHNTVYRWPNIIDQAIVLMADSIKESSMDILASSAAKAAMIKIAGLDSDNEKIRQDSAAEILDRVNGKPAQRNTQEITLTNVDVSKLTDAELEAIIASRSGDS